MSQTKWRQQQTYSYKVNSANRRVKFTLYIKVTEVIVANHHRQGGQDYHEQSGQVTKFLNQKQIYLFITENQKQIYSDC